jgi:hypothetical protein
MFRRPRRPADILLVLAEMSQCWVFPPDILSGAKLFKLGDVHMTVGPICYLRGTYIRTPGGERKIEELNVGNHVVAFSGESKPIKWIGRQSFKKSTECWPKDFEPIRISRFALDERSPHRDLYVSPNHAIYIDGVLIPAKYLVNGLNIAQCAPEDANVIDYLHIELFTHDVIYAEGATAETFGSRGS